MSRGLLGGDGAVRARNDSAWLIPNDGSRTNHQLRQDMRRYDEDQEVDLVVVGAGAGGSVLTQRLARAGWSVVTLDAGPFWDPDADWVSDERVARMVAVAGYSIETPRLLLLSTSKRWPDGLGNDHDQVGRYLMVQGAPQTAGRFDDEIRMYKAPPPEVSSEQLYETDPSQPYKRGWSIQTVSPLPITWAEHVTAQGHWGAPLREYMRDYAHWATLGALCEYLPQAANRVTLAAEKDRHGLPVAHFSYSQCDNDRQLTKAATASMEAVLKGAGASDVMTIDRYAHLVGGARMAGRAQDGVVDAAHRVFDVPNLYVVDGSTLPTQGSANPALTIMALAARAADRLIRLGRRGLPEQQTAAMS